ncbi:MAG TPA: glutamate racemase [Dehalococcoidia bacterium]|nr:glutamate racemase [Dehalococcoidia bacterium]
MAAPTVVVFDSGLGGLTVYREAVKLRPDARYVYCADDAFFPYSDQDATTLTARVLEVMARIVSRYKPDLVVVACNTASTVVLPELRSTFDVPFVGTVPAIKPACAISCSKLVSILGTEATVRREYTQTLIRDFAGDCEVTLVGSASLAAIAEASLRGEPVDEGSIVAEIAPCFVETAGRRTDVVVLACTHYPLLLDRLQRLAPWPIEWLDPAPAIARRVAGLLGAARAGETPGPPLADFTSGSPPLEVLVRFGLRVQSA